MHVLAGYAVGSEYMVKKINAASLNMANALTLAVSALAFALFLTTGSATRGKFYSRL